MVNSQFKNLLMVCAFIIAGLFITQGMKAYGTLGAKVVAQDAATEGLMRFKEMFSALSGSREKWDKFYRREDSVQDLVTLLAAVNFEQYGIETDNDNVVVTKVEPVKQGDADLGLTKICLSTGVGDGGTLFVRAANYQALLNGIDRLAKRPDIYIGNIALQGDRAFPLARLGDFCVYLRNN